MDKIPEHEGIGNIEEREILRSLQSDVRRRALHYLAFIFPGYANVAEISRSTESDHINVGGALNGDGKRYSRKKALVNMGLVEIKKADHTRYDIIEYRITSKGLEIEKSFYLSFNAHEATPINNNGMTNF